MLAVIWIHEKGHRSLYGVHKLHWRKSAPTNVLNLSAAHCSLLICLFFLWQCRDNQSPRGCFHSCQGRVWQPCLTEPLMSTFDTVSISERTSEPDTNNIHALLSLITKWVTGPFLTCAGIKREDDNTPAELEPPVCEADGSSVGLCCLLQS